MSDRKHVLCVSDDAAFRDGLAAPLEWSYPQVEVETAAAFDAAIEYFEQNDIDCVVTDYHTAASVPAVLQAVRERHPEVAVLLLAPFETDDGSGTAVAEVVDFVGDIGEPDADEALGGWVTNALVRGPREAASAGEDGLRELVGDVKQGLADADSPLDIERAVCEQLTLRGRYAFAWIGEYDRGESEVVPWVSATSVDEWPISTTFPVGESAPSVVDRVLRTRDPLVVDDVAASGLSVPWKDVALDHGCTACLTLPLIADEELYGVMGVYTQDPGGITDADRDAMAEISATVSKTLHTIAIHGRIDQQERVLTRYERLVETVGDGMYVLDADGHFMTVNNGLVSMTGYTREGLLGEHVSIVLDDADVRRGRDAIRDMLKTDDSDAVAVEMNLRAKDGTVIPCENQIALLVRDGEFDGTVGVVRDVTERKKRQRELERQNERLEAFAEIVSHDLRNPLSVAQGYLDMVLDTDDTSGLENVADALGRMEDIIGDVLALARHGQTVTETNPVELSAVVREAWGNVETDGADLVVADSIVISADRSRVLRLFENLFRNAVEHGGSDVSVTVGLLAHASGGTTDRGEGRARSFGFYVADGGPGMPPDVREHAFESEFSTSEDGLGLGLWVVREVASAHGWTTTVTESEAGGARFEFADVKLANERAVRED